MNTRKLSISVTATLAISMLVTMSAVLAQTQDENALHGIDVDNAPELQALRDNLSAQWEADATAAGIDIGAATAQPPDGEDGDDSPAGE